MKWRGRLAWFLLGAVVMYLALWFNLVYQLYNYFG